MILAAIVEVCPGFRPEGPPIRHRKSMLVPGRVDDSPAVAKCALRLDPTSPWAWYARREQSIYERFATDPPPVRVPRMIASDPARGILVLERLEGRPLATGRRATRPVGAHVVEALMASIEQLVAWGRDLPNPEPPTREQRRRMRIDLLEDPASDGQWCVEGARRCAELGLAPLELAERLADRPLAFGHGDLLLRNVIEVEGALALVDWECAGPHPAGWDLALLSIQLVADDAARVVADPDLSGFAHAREAYFRRPRR